LEFSFLDMDLKHLPGASRKGWCTIVVLAVQDGARGSAWMFHPVQAADRFVPASSWRMNFARQ
jgi:hypothetical protein